LNLGRVRRRLRFAAVQPELDIGPITLQTFGIMFALAFVAAGALVAKRLDELGKPVDWAYELIFAALVGGIVGARLDFVIENYSEVKDDLLGNIFSGSGLVWYGGAIGGAIAVCLWAYFRRMLNLRLLDLCAPSLAIGYAIGRIGCQVSGDGDYGIPWDGPWAMAYPDGTVPTDVPVHPTPIYETLAMGLAAYGLWRLRNSFRPGLLFALYLVVAGLERFLIEFIRRNDEVLAGLTQAQVLSIAMIAVGGAWLLVKASRHELWAEPADRSAPEAGRP
jgi:phosphatidylglycerol---prolipoprotein diacylglyceryl transferase